MGFELNANGGLALLRHVAGLTAAFVLFGIVAASPAAAVQRPWPPVPKQGDVFVHFGEEHLDDEDGPRIFPEVIEQSSLYDPDLVTASGDKSSDGTVENLETWRALMSPYDAKGIPYFAGVGNHDRKARLAIPGGLDPMGDLGNYMDIFAERPYPFGDAAPYDVPELSSMTRPASDPAGASSHYAVDYGSVRWVFIDNSCFGITNCDPLQNPPFPDAEGNQGQFDLLASEGAKATADGDLLFVVMHMPTQDDRPGHSNPTPGPHTMGEGTSPDNQLFERQATAAGVDGVFAGHIKGMWQYSAGGVPYFTDGGAGGEVYVGPGEETGVDYGYWHGYRLIRVRDGKVTTDAIPIFEPGGIKIDGPKRIKVGEVAQFSAVGQQPTEEGPDVMLELRPPDPDQAEHRKPPSTRLHLEHPKAPPSGTGFRRARGPAAQRQAADRLGSLQGSLSRARDDQDQEWLCDGALPGEGHGQGREGLPKQVGRSARPVDPAATRTWSRRTWQDGRSSGSEVQGMVFAWAAGVHGRQT